MFVTKKTRLLFSVLEVKVILAQKQKWFINL